jgi:hypothetical protein
MFTSESETRQSLLVITTMFFDLNVPIPQSLLLAGSKSKKGKDKEKISEDTAFSAASIKAIESKIDILVHCEYFDIYLSIIDA